MTDKRKPDWNKILLACKHLEDYVDLRAALDDPEYKQAEGGYNPVSKDGTSRTHIRVTSDQKEWGTYMSNNNVFPSREMVFGACVGFAQAYPEAFLKYVQRSATSATVQNIPSPDTSTNSEESSDSDTEQMDTTPELGNMENGSNIPGDNFDDIPMDQIEEDINTK